MVLNILRLQRDMIRWVFSTWTLAMFRDRKQHGHGLELSPFATSRSEDAEVRGRDRGNDSGSVSSSSPRQGGGGSPIPKGEEVSIADLLDRSLDQPWLRAGAASRSIASTSSDDDDGDHDHESLGREGRQWKGGGDSCPVRLQLAVAFGDDGDDDDDDDDEFRTPPPTDA